MKHCKYSLRPAEPRDSARWLSALNVNLGIDTGGGGARRHASATYLQNLKQSKIIVSCQPTPWEGDWRLGESLASGALVLHNHMLDPYPGLVHGESIVLFNSTEQMLGLLKWYIDHPSEADRVAANGRKVAASWTPQDGVEAMIRAVAPEITVSSPLKVHLHPIPSGCANEEVDVIEEGLAESPLVTLTDAVGQAVVMVINLLQVEACVSKHVEPLALFVHARPSMPPGSPASR